MINNLAGVSVFEKHADAHLMPTVANFAIKRACHRKIPSSALRELFDSHRGSAEQAPIALGLNLAWDAHGILVRGSQRQSFRSRSARVEALGDVRSMAQRDADVRG